MSESSAQPAVASYIAPYLAMLPPNARLLAQAGASDGALARAYLRTYPAASVRPLAADPDAAAEEDYRQLQWADGWIFDATLEQLNDPLGVLRAVRKVIQFDACIVARIANGHYWNRPAAEQGQRLGIAAMLALFGAAGFRVVSGVAMSTGTMPAELAEALRQRAQAGEAGVPLPEEAQPSHYLIKAMPA